MANNPLQKLQDAVVGTVKGAVRHPVGTAGRAVSQAKETVAVGRTVAEQVVGGVVGGVAGGVAARVGRVARAGSHVVPGVPQQHDAETAAGTSDTATEAAPAPTPITDAPTRKAAAKRAATKKAGARPRVTKPPVTDVASKRVAEQAKHQPVKAAPAGPENPIDAAADPRLVDVTPADVAKKAAAKAPGKKAAAAKAPAKKAPAKKSPAKKAPAKKSTAKKSTAEAAATPAESTPTKTAPAKTAPAEKGTTRKAAARKTSPRQAATPSGYLPVEGSAAGKEPLSAEELAGGAGSETITPVGTRGADVAHNPDTTSEDLQQPGTPPLMDPGTVHAVEAEAEMLSRAADPDKG